MRLFCFNGYIVYMNEKNETRKKSVIQALLQESGRLSGVDELTITPLSGDGSNRNFWRIEDNGRKICLAVAPPVTDKLNLAEARAARAIGLHLFKKGVRVPEQYAWDKESGILLFEDFGDTKLHDHVQLYQKSDTFVSAIRPVYVQTVKDLARMQVEAVVGFDPQWCWDTPSYDKNLMLERESEYFLRAFWQDLLGEQTPPGLREEFVFVAERAAQIPADFFLHRDFQSRNIMLHEEMVCFIDFQGGRLGPLAYDLASLLIDPYVELPPDFQEELLAEYLNTLEQMIVVDRSLFVEEYLLLALQRNLQIAGAFSFLSHRAKKGFFKQFLKPAIDSLNALLQKEFFASLPVLRKTVATALLRCRQEQYTN